MIQYVKPDDIGKLGLEGPFYHGTSADNWFFIEKNGFSLGKNSNPLLKTELPHHLFGNGFYFTRNLSRAKKFSPHGAAGVREFYLDTGNKLKVSFNSINDYRKFVKDIVGDEQFNVTGVLTKYLQSRYDSVEQMGRYDGQQIVVYDPRKIYLVEKRTPQKKKLQVGTRVVYDSVEGVVEKIESLTQTEILGRIDDIEYSFEVKKDSLDSYIRDIMENNLNLLKELAQSSNKDIFSLHLENGKRVKTSRSRFEIL